VFFAGVSLGWIGKTWLGPVHSLVTANFNQDNQDAATRSGTIAAAPQSSDLIRTEPNAAAPASQNILDISPQSTPKLSSETSAGITIFDYFQKLLNERLYYDAMNLYQEQNEQVAAQLKNILLEQLNQLAAARNSNDFSELIQSYLSVYYDDIDVLIRLADFNQSNGRYLEAVDVYLLAKTYAYTTVDQQNVIARFNDFIEEIDSSYTNQKNWIALINLYSHINASGLMTSPFQYQQALAHLRSGDEYFAIEQLKQLLNDSLMGESAAIALNRLTANTQAPAAPDRPALQDSEAIQLQKLGNQYLVNLTINRSDDVKLLIDTGASITTLSRAAFESLNSFDEAEKRDRRAFRTAGGVVMGTVYSFPEVSLGAYLMKNTQIAVLDFDTNREIDGLLGMNVLGQFRFQIDQENTRLLLSRE